MALVEPVLRQYGLQKFRNLRFRGGNLLGSAIGVGIGIGYGLAKDFEFTFPWSPSLQPSRSGRTVIGSPPSNGSADQRNQTLRATKFARYRKRSYTQRNRRKHNCCICCNN